MTDALKLLDQIDTKELDAEIAQIGARLTRLRRLRTVLGTTLQSKAPRANGEATAAKKAAKQNGQGSVADRAAEFLTGKSEPVRGVDLAKGIGCTGATICTALPKDGRFKKTADGWRLK